MGTKQDWPDKVKIWELRYLKETPIDRIRQEWASAGLEGIVPSWDTLNRVVNEFPLLTRAQVRQLPDALQERWSELQPKVNDKQQGLDGELLALLERQQGELGNLSIISLLRSFYVQDWDPVAEFTKPEIRQAFLNGWRESWETIDRREKAKLFGVSTVENDVVYERLRQANPDAETWQAVEVYDESKLAFIETFASWITLVEHTIEQGPQKEDAKGNRSSYTATVGRLTDKLKRSSPDYWLYLRLRGLALACQLVRLGIEEQGTGSYDATYVGERAKVWSFFNDIIRLSVQLLPRPLWLAEQNGLQNLAESLWHIDDPVKSKTMRLLEARARVDTAWKNLREKANLWGIQPSTGSDG